ncbi:XTP/dITP diphosphatase [Stetteria hydrogenophila]
MIYLVTGNRHKLEEARDALRGYPLRLEAAGVGKLEVQSESVEEIALTAARHAYAQLRRPVAVDDTALEVAALNGFPGPYASYVYKTLGVWGILKLLEGSRDRRACFKTAVALVIPPHEKVFTGVTCGVIVEEPRGSRGFGFDPIFAPEGSSRTYAEMTVEEKNRYSHRAKAFRAMAEWLVEEYSLGGRG